MNKQMNWIELGLLNESSTDFSDYSNDIGVYRATFDGEVVYIGKATELNNGGFRKRLRDYTRLSNSARNYPAGEQMFRHRNEILIEIVVFNRSKDSIPDIEELETQLIKEKQPIWNNQEK